MKILSIIGVRPQFVKASSLSREIDKREGIEEIILHSGQHFDDKMSNVFFKEMGIRKPSYNLNINSLSHGAMTGRMIEGIEEIIKKEANIDVVVVYGDTNTTLAGAIASSKLNVKIAHIESGLRSNNMAMPEETNRIVTDRVSNYLFCPTKTSFENLKQEGFLSFKDKRIVLSGDIMQDSCKYYSTISSEKSNIINELSLRDFVLCTIHRQENTDCIGRLFEIVDAINEINETIDVVVPLHPRTKKILELHRINLNAKTIPPASYFDILELLKRCKMVLTDSGGLQKEAYFFGKKSIILRNETEWKELIDCKESFLSGADTNNILEIFEKTIELPFSSKLELFGDGNSSKVILDSLIN